MSTVFICNVSPEGKTTPPTPTPAKVRPLGLPKMDFGDGVPHNASPTLNGIPVGHGQAHAAHAKPGPPSSGYAPMGNPSTDERTVKPLGLPSWNW